MLANGNMVSDIVISSILQSDHPSSDTRFVDAERDPTASTERQNFPCRLACLRGQYSSSGLSSRKANLILSSWRAGTNKRYSSVWQKFCGWCCSKQINPVQSSLVQVAEFLTQEFDTGKCYRAINSYRSALSSVLPPTDGKPVGQHPLIVRLLKGIFHEKPPLPRYTVTWNVDTVLTYLQTLHPVAGLSLKLLTLKLNALLALVTAQRAQTLVALDTTYMSITPNTITFVVAAMLKTSKPSKDPLQLTICRFSEDVSLCPYLTLQEYLTRTGSSRVAANATRLLLSFIKPYRPISTDTCSRWLKTVLLNSGVHVSIFKEHSYRGAATSKAVSQGVSVDLILKTADWSTENVFTRFYRRDSIPYDQCFSNSVLTSVQ